MLARVLLVTFLMTVVPLQAATLPNQPVTRLDLPRYLGTWHEIAHLPLYFQQQCVGEITATYTRLANGRLGVHNACRTAEGSISAVDGEARATSDQPGALKVRFAPAWLAWLPWVWADYWVVELDPAYRWAVVGSPSQKYLWILSRTPSMRRTLFEQIRQRARDRGYPVDQLIIAAPLKSDASTP